MKNIQIKFKRNLIVVRMLKNLFSLNKLKAKVLIQ